LQCAGSCIFEMIVIDRRAEALFLVLTAHIGLLSLQC
jgi:hypothetical protein